MKEFVIVAVNLLNSLFKEGKTIPVTSRYQSYISNGKFVRGKRFLHPLFDVFILANHDLLTELNEFKNCINYCKQSETFQKHLLQLNSSIRDSKESIETYLKNEYLFPILAKLLHSVGGLSYDKDAFDALYYQMELHLDSKFMHLIALVPIKNFELLGKEEVVFDETAKVSVIENRELNLLIDSGNVNLEMIETLPPYALKIDFWAEKSSPIEHQIPSKEIQNVFRAFRISKKGALWFDHIYCIPLSWEPTRSLSIFLNQIAQGFKYVLAQGEENNLLLIWKNLNDIKPENRYIEIAAEKFDYATFRQRTEDKLVDYISALEALLLGADEKAELEYRLALRLATLIGESADEKVFIRHILKAAYAQRSCIVHGKKLKLTQIDGQKHSIEDLTAYLENYTRRALQIFIKMTTQKITQEEFLDRLDDALLKFSGTPSFL